jgi:hypothetical protein
MGTAPDADDEFLQRVSKQPSLPSRLQQVRTRTAGRDPGRPRGDLPVIRDKEVPELERQRPTPR